MAKKKSGGKRKRQHGGAWYDTLWSGVKSIAGPVNDLLKSTKILSTVASAVPQTRAFSPVVGALGYGKHQSGNGRRSVILA